MEKYAEICGDNRFELIAKYKAKLIEGTNIEMAKEEMDVIDNILFRFWQMGWLDKLEPDVVPRSEYDNLKMQFTALDVECERLEKVEEDFHKAKQDVVREVIDSFQKMLKAETHYETSITGHRYPVVDIDEIDYIAEELKKKYVEEKGE